MYGKCGQIYIGLQMISPTAWQELKFITRQSLKQLGVVMPTKESLPLRAHKGSKTKPHLPQLENCLKMA
jgi:hypothetical protein